MSLKINPITGKFDLVKSLKIGSAISGGTDGYILFSDAGKLAEDSGLFWDNVNKRLGLGTTTPSEQLEITGNFEIPTTSATVGIIKQNGDNLLHTFGTDNLFLGASTGNLTTSGIGKNVAIGNNALNEVTTGHYNMTIGYDAGTKIKDGDSNVALGAFTLTKIENVNSNMAIGTYALQNNLTAANVAIGVGALRYQTTGADNLAIGSNALLRLTTGYSNVAIGDSAGLGNSGMTNINQNLFIGRKAGRSIDTGASNNTFLGYLSGDLVSTGTKNIFVGSESGRKQTTNSNLLIIDNQIRADAATELTNSILYGVMAATPAAQTLRVNASVNAMDKSMMTHIGGFAVKLTNKTGAVTVQGQLVKADTATNDAVVITGVDDSECFGVFLEAGVAIDAEAWVVVSGIAEVAMKDNTAATRGNWVEASTEAGYADATNASPTAAPKHFDEIGHCIETVAAGGAGTHILARCILHFN